MNDSARVCECNRIAHFEEDFESGMKREPFLQSGIVFSQPVDNLFERESVNQLHGKIGNAAPSSSDVMNGNDIGMFERCGDSSLFEEAELFFRRSVLRNSHRDASSDIEVIGLQNDFHSA